MPAKAAAFGEAHGCRIHASLDDLLADPAVDIVVNLTVQQAHHEVTKRALEAGRHVYSEKPMALRPDEARELIDVAARHGVRLALRARDVPRRGPADRGGVDPRRAAGTDPRRLRGRQPRADRDLAPGAAGVLRRRRAGRRRRLPADAGHDDGRAGAVRAGVGLGPAAGPGDRRRDAVPHRPPRPDRRGRRARRRGGAAADGARSTSAGRPSSAAASSSTATRARSRSATSRSSTPRSRSGPMTATTRRSPGSASRSPASTGDAGSRTSPRRSPRTGHTARPPSRPPTWSTSSMRRRARWRMRAGRSR